MLQFVPHLAQHLAQSAQAQDALSAARTADVEPAANATHSATILNKRFIFVSFECRGGKSTPEFRRTFRFMRTSRFAAEREKRKSRAAAAASAAAAKPHCERQNRSRAAAPAKSPATPTLMFGSPPNVWPAARRCVRCCVKRRLRDLIRPPEKERVCSNAQFAEKRSRRNAGNAALLASARPASARPSERRRGAASARFQNLRTEADRRTPQQARTRKSQRIAPDKSQIVNAIGTYFSFALRFNCARHLHFLFYRVRPCLRDAGACGKTRTTLQDQRLP